MVKGFLTLHEMLVQDKCMIFAVEAKISVVSALRSRAFLHLVRFANYEVLFDTLSLDNHNRLL